MLFWWLLYLPFSPQFRWKYMGEMIYVRALCYFSHFLTFSKTNQRWCGDGLYFVIFRGRILVLVHKCSIKHSAAKNISIYIKKIVGTANGRQRRLFSCNIPSALNSRCYSKAHTIRCYQNRTNTAHLQLGKVGAANWLYRIVRALFTTAPTITAVP